MHPGVFLCPWCL